MSGIPEGTGTRGSFSKHIRIHGKSWFVFQHCPDHEEATQTREYVKWTPEQQVVEVKMAAFSISGLSTLWGNSQPVMVEFVQGPTW